MDDLRTPPNDRCTEQAVLSCILISPDAFDRASQIIGPDDFFDPSHVTIFRTFSKLTRSGKPTDDLILLCEQLERQGDFDDIGGRLYMTELHDTIPIAAHTEYYATIVKENALRRQALRVSESLHRNCLANDGRNIEEIVGEAEGDLHKIIERDVAEQVDVGDLLLEWTSVRQQGKQRGIPTGWQDIDQLLGGLKPSSLYVIAARPSVGKTSFAINLLIDLAKRKFPVLLFSFEQNSFEVVERLLSSLSGIPAEKIAENRLEETDNAKLVQAQNRLAELPIQIDDGSSNMTRIAAATRVRKRRDKLAIVAVDYLQLIVPEDGRIQREQQVAAMSRSLKRLAMILEIPVLCLAQLNRGVELRNDKRPRLSDLRESGAIEQDADAVLFLDRPVTYDDKADPTDATLIVAKNRSGRTGDVKLKWDGPTMTFRSAARSWEESACG